MAKFSDFLKNLFLILILVQIGPTLLKSIKTQYSNYLEKKTKVGVLPIKGVIYSSDTYVKDLRTFFEDDEIKAIVLKIECPGGASGASQNIFNEIKVLKCQYKKYVIAFVENIAASGGYYIASAADYIITAPSSFIGSIGVYIPHPNIKEFIEQYKIKYEVVKTGEYKTMGNPFHDLTENQRKLLQDITNNVYDQFIKDMFEQRPNLPKDIKVWAEGKIFTGKQALELTLIDELGSQSTVIKTLKEKAQIVEKIEWVKPTKKIGFFQSLLYPGEDEESLSFKSLIMQIIDFFQTKILMLV